MNASKYSDLRTFFNKKGITPIISIILLLMMTIAIAGLSFTFIQRVQASVENQTETTSSKLVGDLTTLLRVEGVTLESCGGSPVRGDVTIFYRNIGIQPAHNVQLFVNDAFIEGAYTEEITPGPVNVFVSADQGLPTNVQGVTTTGLDNLEWNGTSRTVKITSEEGVFQGTFSFVCSS